MMFTYAFINTQNIVIEIICGIDPTETQTDIDGTIVGGSVEAWQTFYETQPIHINDICRLCSEAVSIGWTYDSVTGTFIAPPQPDPIPTPEA